MVSLVRPRWQRWLRGVGLCCVLACLVVLSSSCKVKLCYYCGSYYDEGETFPSFDLCNTCVCKAEEFTGLGLVQCSQENQCEGYCYYNNVKYSSNQTFQIQGRCARCDCRDANVREFDKCGGLRFCLAIRYCS